MSAPLPLPTDELREHARAAGFERIGVARAEASPDAERYATWLAAGHHADLSYMERDPARRSDPRAILEGCRSVVVGTVGYHTPDPAGTAALPAEFARYARGRDYHRVLKSMLKTLCLELDALAERHDAGPDVRHRWYVDTGPVLERSWARDAGIGFLGKNTCLIDPERGSWSLLGVVLTTLELEVDRPVETSCGTCSACIPACPTGAIVAPGVVDSRRCLSYWTIEHRGSLPEEMRRALGTRVFGCDDCQTVCPWNRFAQPTSVDDLRPREMFVDADLARLAALDESAWDDATRGSAVRRVGYAGLMRNVAVALGNSGDPRARPHLERLALHESELVREHARWGLDRLRATKPQQGDSSDLAQPPTSL